MKILHCADIHLDSVMESNLSPEQAKERKRELLLGFADMVRYGAEHDVRAFLIAGDLFDGASCAKRTRAYVLDLVRQYPQIDFYYLSGNHDEGEVGFTDTKTPLPENLHTFGKDWQEYKIDHVSIFGCIDPLGKEAYESLTTDPDRVNIVMLHGQVYESDSRYDAGVNLRALQDKGLDYVALGHIHSYRIEQLDARGVWCYAGCPEGRGFDECGNKGFVMLDVDGEGKIGTQFVSLSRRKCHVFTADVSECYSLLSLEQAVLDACAVAQAQDMVKVELVGSVAPETCHDAKYAANVLQSRFYFAKVYDKTRLSIRAEDYRNDISLKGEFVRLVLASSLDEEVKLQVIEKGIRALGGEEVDAS
ncbi:MAG: DNA repair exonuclease [Clostridia bacterium]|nr:DNA repair exonuclease [Clostridia bacterium]MBQ2256534.1 DNA repair exonuclease [Clostridia bacterium]